MSERIQKLEASGEAWIDVCASQGLKKVETALKDAESLGLPGIESATFNEITQEMIGSILFGLQHMALLTVCPQSRTDFRPPTDH